MCVALVELRYRCADLTFMGRYGLILGIHPGLVVVAGVIVEPDLGTHAQNLHQGRILAHQHAV